MQEDLGALSERELEVLKLVASGKTNQQVARALVISPNTVKVHLRNIFEKLGVQSRTEATMEAVRRGWVPVGTAVLIGESLAALPEQEPSARLAEARGRPPLAPWMRAYALVILLVTIFAVLTPIWQQLHGAAAPSTPFTDIGRPQVDPAPRAEVPRWTAVAGLPEPRSRLALAEAGGRLYAIGGETAAGVTDAVSVYDPQSNGWLPGMRKPTAVSNVAAAFLAGRIYVPGGTTGAGETTNVLEVFDVGAASWASGASLPSVIAAYGLAAAEGKIHLFGGWDGRDYSAATFIYDPAEDRWTEGVPLPSPRAFLSATTLDGQIYVLGGAGGGKELSEVLSYDLAWTGPEGTPWTLRAPLSQPRAGLASAAVGSRLYAIGGARSDGTPAYNEQYDPKLGAWSRIITPRTGQWRNMGLVAFENHLYAVGGWSGSHLDANEQYQALVRQLLPLGGAGS